MKQNKETLNRREFLALCALGGLPGLLSACQGASPKGSNVTLRPGKRSSPSAQASPTRQPAATSNDWSELSRSLQGTLIRPGSPQYQTARQLFDPRFDHVFPAAIAYCASPKDVQSCLAFAQRFGLPLVPRAGGHSYAGYSTTTGLVLDVTRINEVRVDAENGTATIGAGARLIDIYAALAQHGLLLPAGTCPTVGIAGLALGGGVGVLSRKFGLTCDNLSAAQVVVADGRLLTCDAKHYPDLFWALCGAGGGNFGIVTSLTFRIHQVAMLSLFTLYWPWSSAASVVDAWQHWAPKAPDELWSGCLLQATSDRSAEPFVEVYGVYNGNGVELNSLLLQLSSQVDLSPTSRSIREAGPLEAMLHEANCDGMTVNQCHLPSQNPEGQISRSSFQAKSDYFTNFLPREGIDNLVNAISNNQNSPLLGEGGIGLDALGGAINRVAPGATAFVHRNALFSAQYAATWNADASASVVTANRSWLKGMWQKMRPYASGAAYQNYIDADLVNWQQAYYGSNLPQLRRVKATYDPENFFHFTQSIPPDFEPAAPLH